MSLAIGEDTYLTVADADAYFAARNAAGWAAAPSVAREAALLQATAYIDGSYAFRGRIADPGQPLSWPRRDAVDSEGRSLSGIPRRVEHATAELALIALAGELAPPLERGGKVLREKVGPVEVNYMPDAVSGRSYPLIDLLLRPLLRPAASHEVIRA